MMATELTMLAWSVLLGCVTSSPPPRWSPASVDEVECFRRVMAMQAARPLAGRLQRAQANFLETFRSSPPPPSRSWPGAATTPLHTGGAGLLLGAVVYLPLYAAGVPYVRSLVWPVCWPSALVFALL
jgi:uncharacterized MAPEG superfamily protein